MTTLLPTEPIRQPRAPKHRAEPRPVPAVTEPGEAEVFLASQVAALIAEARGYQWRGDLDEIPDPPAMPMPALARRAEPTVPPVLPVGVSRMQSLGRWARGLVDPLSRPLPALGTQQEA